MPNLAGQNLEDQGLNIVTGGSGAAAEIALINSFTNLAGFVSPTVIGWLKFQTGSLSPGLYTVAGTLTLAAVLVWGYIPAKLVNR